jgi:hypothetical protein
MKPPAIDRASLAACLIAALVLAATTLAGQQAPVAFDSNRAWEHLRQLVAIGPRPAGSPEIETTRRYIKTQLTATGVTVADQAWDDHTPLGRTHMVNLIATIPGASRDRIVISGHYDTKLYRQFRFVGASDGASSAAFLIEIARVLKARRNPLTMEVLFLDGEEAVVEWAGTDHTYGSRHYVESAKRDGSIATLKANILVDMIGARDLQLRRDANSTPWLVDIVWNAAKRLQLDSAFVPLVNTVEDDHMPFLQAGVPSVDLIDLDNYREWHTANDNLDAVGARSLQIVGDVVMAALPQIEARLKPRR